MHVWSTAIAYQASWYIHTVPPTSHLYFDMDYQIAFVLLLCHMTCCHCRLVITHSAHAVFGRMCRQKLLSKLEFLASLCTRDEACHRQELLSSSHHLKEYGERNEMWSTAVLATKKLIQIVICSVLDFVSWCNIC